MIGAVAGDIIGSRFEGHPGPLLFHPRCRFTDDSLLARHSGRALLGNRDFAAQLRVHVRRHPGRGYGEPPALGSPRTTSGMMWIPSASSETVAATPGSTPLRRATCSGTEKWIGRSGS